MDDKLNKQIADLNIILMDNKGKSVLVTGLNKEDDYAKIMIDYEIFPNRSDKTFSVKLIFADNTTLEYPSVVGVDFKENFKTTIWIHEKGMEEPHYKIVFDEIVTTYVSVVN